MNVYQYIASSNPSFARQICSQYGYKPINVRTSDDLAICLSKLVSVEGEPAFRDIMDGHPDKDVILELNSKPVPEKYTAADGTNEGGGYGCMNGCGCRNCQNRQMNHYMNADGGGSRESAAMSLTSVSIIAASLIIGLAVITRNK